MLRKKISMIVMSAAMAMGTTAVAEDGVYFGGGLAFSSANSPNTGLGTGDSNVNFPGLGLVLGYRMDRGAGFFGAEIDGEISGGALFTSSVSGLDCSGGSMAPYMCAHDSTIRLRGIAGKELANGMEAFGTLGFVQVKGQAAVSPAPNAVIDVTNTGFTVGFGLQKDTASGNKLRFELVYDKADTSNHPTQTPAYNAVTAKVGFIF